MTVRATAVDALAIASLDRTLHEPARLGVVACLYVVDEADFVFLQSQTGITGGNLSSHLKRLAQEGYIDVRKEFEGAKPRTTLSLTTRGRARFKAYLATIDEMLKVLRTKLGAKTDRAVCGRFGARPFSIGSTRSATKALPSPYRDRHEERYSTVIGRGPIPGRGLPQSGTPAARRTAIIGHQPVNADCSRFKPTKAVSQ